MAKKETRGRKPKKPADLRSEVLYIKLTPAERKALDKAANGRVTVWAREILLREVGDYGWRAKVSRRPPG